VSGDLLSLTVASIAKASSNQVSSSGQGCIWRATATGSYRRHTPVVVITLVGGQKGWGIYLYVVWDVMPPSKAYGSLLDQPVEISF